MNLALKHKDPQVKPAVFEHGIPHALCCGSFGFSGYRNEGGTRLHVALKHKDPQDEPAVFEPWQGEPAVFASGLRITDTPL